jgi:hypothetical protein
MDFQEFIQNKANELVSLDWPDDMILSFIDGAEQVKNYFGWHPASEVPQINKKVVAITTNGKAQEDVYYDGNRYCWNGLTIKIKWWCYPPKED